ncbi:hypothetical protein W97_01592 [Coniosporium apollinis CBS 100218]|uniref:Uncharacterized protein n=1 Tax=Coniosporium apollinis (strain CBS 100218) TaxID=1168221 RepID=R7YKE0_CONA1|nr:uncharacterized protein W97_01592 [Coniosporium apollinis CBS 100218]EON62370.1 hypothetical protein W97_01592 [Coniosporium apollinis CBS 100218]
MSAPSVTTLVSADYTPGSPRTKKPSVRQRAGNRRPMTNVFFQKKGGKAQTIFSMTATTKGLTRYSSYARQCIERPGGSLQAGALRLELRAAGEKEAGVVLKYMDDNADVANPALLRLPAEETLEYYIKVYEVVEKLEFPRSLHTIRQAILEWITFHPLDMAEIKLICTTFPAEHGIVHRMLHSIPHLQAQGFIAEEDHTMMVAMIGRFPKVQALNEALHQKKQMSLQRKARGASYNYTTSSTGWTSRAQNAKHYVDVAGSSNPGKSMAKSKPLQASNAKSNGHKAVGKLQQGVKSTTQK